MQAFFESSRGMFELLCLAVSVNENAQRGHDRLARSDVAPFDEAVENAR